MKERIINILIGVLIGVVITSIGFVIYINASGVNKRHNLGNPPQMMQCQDFGRNDRGMQGMPNGEQPQMQNNQQQPQAQGNQQQPQAQTNQQSQSNQKTQTNN